MRLETIRVTPTRTNRTKTKAILTGAMPIRRTPAQGMSADRRSVLTATTRTIPMRAHRMAFMVRSGSQAEYLSALDLGITGAGVMVDIGVVAGTGAVTSGVTGAAATAAAMPVTTVAAATDVVTPAAVDIMAQAPFAVVVDTMAEAAVDPTAVAGPTVEAVSTVEAVATAGAATAADTGNRQ